MDEYDRTLAEMRGNPGYDDDANFTRFVIVMAFCTFFAACLTLMALPERDTEQAALNHDLGNAGWELRR